MLIRFPLILPVRIFLHWLGDGHNASFLQASVLDAGKMKPLGKFDIVYSWGVLHHTGNMTQALADAAKCVRPGGFADDCYL